MICNIIKSIYTISSQVQSIWWFAHSTGSPCFNALCVADCHWRFGLWDCTGMCSRSIVFEVVIDTIIRGWLFPSLCITQVLTVSSVRGSLCGQDVVRSWRACFVCDLGQIPRFPNRIQNSHCLMIWQAGLICIFFRLEARTEMADCGQLGLS